MIDHLFEHLYQLTRHPILGLLLTLVVYQLAVKLYRRVGQRAFLHPVATAAVAIAAILHWIDLPYAQYLQANDIIYFLLGPTTVALAVPLYRELPHLRHAIAPVLITVMIGGTFAAVSAVTIAWIMGADQEVLLALSAKSVTSPIALEIASSIGALATLTTGVVVFTGVVGVVLSPVVFYLLRLRDCAAQGVVLGINAHGIGTARGFEISADGGAFATLTMGLTGAFTALTLPYLIAFF